jgi:hypothetical protein
VGLARGDLDRALEWLRDPASDAAAREAHVASPVGLAVGAWRVRAADASFYRRDTAEARELYLRALEGERDYGTLCEIYLRLADVAFLDGELSEERRLREHYHGALGE